MNTEKTHENVMKVMNKESIESMVLPRLHPLKDLMLIREKNLVHFSFLEMQITFYVPIRVDNKWLLITEDIMEKAGMTSQELLKAAKRNIDEKCRLKNLSEMLSEALGTPTAVPGTELPLYVATIDSVIPGRYGAAAILSDKFLQSVSEQFGGEVIILPSSKHEVLLMPKTDSFKYEYLVEVVREVNRTEVDEKDFLSDYVFVYKDGDFKVIS